MEKSLSRALIILFVSLAVLAVLLSANTVNAQLTPGNFFVADASATIFEVTPSGTVTTFVSGAPLVSPFGITIDANDNLIVTDSSATSVFRISPTGTITTVYSGSPLSAPFGVAVNNAGNYVVTDLSAGQIFEITPVGSLSVVTSSVPSPWGIDVDSSGDYIVVGNGDNSIYRVTPGGSVTLIATNPSFDFLQGLHIDSNGNYIVADQTGAEIFEVTPGGSVSVVFAGAPLSDPGEGIATDNGDIIIPDDSSSSGNAIFRLTPGGSPVEITSGAPFTDLNGLTVAVSQAPPQPQVVTPVPTMTEWGMIAFMVFAGIISLYYLKSKRLTG